MKKLFEQLKQSFNEFTASRTRVAVAFAVVAALLGAVLLLPPSCSTSSGLPAGADATQQTVTDAAASGLDAGSPATEELPSVTISQPTVTVDAAFVPATTDAALPTSSH